MTSLLSEADRAASLRPRGKGAMVRHTEGLKGWEGYVGGLLRILRDASGEQARCAAQRVSAQLIIASNHIWNSRLALERRRRTRCRDAARLAWNEVQSLYFRSRPAIAIMAKSVAVRTSLNTVAEWTRSLSRMRTRARPRCWSTAGFALDSGAAWRSRLAWLMERIASRKTGWAVM